MPHSRCRVQQQQGKPPPLQPPANLQGRAVVHNLCKGTLSHLLLLYFVLSVNTLTAEAAQYSLMSGSTGSHKDLHNMLHYRVMNANHPKGQMHNGIKLACGE